MPMEAKAKEVRIHAKNVRSIDIFRQMGLSSNVLVPYLVRGDRVLRFPCSRAQGYRSDPRTGRTRTVWIRVSHLDLTVGMRLGAAHYLVHLWVGSWPIALLFVYVVGELVATMRLEPKWVRVERDLPQIGVR